jgi:hypothetical protein
MPKKIILGLTGFAMSGKDEVADELVRSCGFVKIGMSDALHECLMVLNPMIDIPEYTMDSSYVRYKDYCANVGYVKAKEHPEVRRLLQVLGTDVGRNMLNPNIWINAMLEKARGIKKVVVTGIRYPNEALACSYIWHIDRPSFGPVNDHCSEQLAADIEERVPARVTIHNTGTLEDLRGWTRKAYEATFGYDHKGYSEEKCVRCGWIMGHPALNCQNDDTPHIFPSQQI